MSKYKSPQDIIDDEMNTPDQETLPDFSPLQWLQSLGRENKDRQDAQAFANKLKPYGTDTIELQKMLNPQPFQPDVPTVPPSANSTINPSVKDYLDKLTSTNSHQTSFNMMDEVKQPVVSKESDKQLSALNPVVKNYLQNKLASSGANSLSINNVSAKEEPFSDAKREEMKKLALSKQAGLGWAQAIAGFGDALAGRNPIQSAQYFQNIRKDIEDSTVGDFDQRKKAAQSDAVFKRQQDQFDPNSSASQSFRKIIEANFPQIAKTYGDSWKDVSAADQENIFQPLKLKESIDARKAQTQLSQQMRGDALTDKLSKAMKDDLDANKGRAGNFGSISGKVQAAERLEGLVLAFKDGNLPPAQMEELALGMSNMIAGSGGTSRAQVEGLLPKSAVGDANKFKAWLFNEPFGAGQQKFVDQMLHTIEREKDVASGQLNQIRKQRLPAHDTLKKLNPTVYNNILESYGMIEKNQTQSNTSQLSSEDKQAIQWAQQNPNDERAKKILQLHGVQ